MKWIGQHIYDLTSRFRDDVYFEDLENGAVDTDKFLIVGSSGKLKYRTGAQLLSDIGAGSGDLTSIVAGTGLIGTDLTGPIPTLSVNPSQVGVTRVGTLANLAVTSSSVLGIPTMVLTNADVDQIALDINASNTTANVVDIDADSLTTGSALNIDVDDALTTASSNSLVKVDYDKSGVTGSGLTNTTTGLELTFHDAVTNHTNSTVIYNGVRVVADSASNQGAIHQTGFSAILTDADVANTIGFSSLVEDGGIDFKAASTADTGDYFTIATTTNGATTLTTVDDDAAAAHFSIVADGDIRLKPATGILRFMDSDNAADYTSLEVGLHGDIKLTTRDIAATAAHFEIEADGDIILDSAGQIKLEPVAGNNILLDGTIAIDAGVVTGATSITSTSFVGALTGSAATLTTPRAINGVDFNGSAAITITAAAGTLTGTALVDTVATSNLTSVGTIENGVWQGTAVASAYLDADTAHLTTDQTFTGVKTFDEAINKKSLSYIWTENKFTNTTANEYYFSLTDVERDVPAGSENGIGVVAIMPCTGILKSVVLNTSSNLSGLSWTYKLKKAASGTASTGESLVATVTSTAGGAANTNKVVSFVTNTVDTNVISYESGFSATVMFSAGDRIMFSQQSNSDASGSPKVQATFVLQLDESTAL